MRMDVRFGPVAAGSRINHVDDTTLSGQCGTEDQRILLVDGIRGRQACGPMGGALNFEIQIIVFGEPAHVHSTTPYSINSEVKVIQFSQVPLC